MIDRQRVEQLGAGRGVELAEPRVAAVGARQQLGLAQQAVVADRASTNAASWRSPLLRSSMCVVVAGACGAGA